MKNKKDELIQKSEDVYASLLYFRLLESLRLTQKRIDANCVLAEKDNGNIFEIGGTRIANFFRESHLSAYSAEKEKTLALIAEFQKAWPEETIYQFGENPEDLRRELIDLCLHDEDGYIRNSMALRVLLEPRFHAPYEKETMEALSSLMYGNAKRLGEIKATLDKTLRKLLSDQVAETVGKTAAIVLGVTSAIALGIALLGATGGKSMALALASIGEHAVSLWGAGALSAAGAIGATTVMAGVIAAVGFAGKGIYQDEKQYKEALRALKPGDLASSLAISITLVALSAPTSPKEKIKEYKENVLKQINEIRSDAEFLYIVEHSEEEDSKTKADICRKAVECLAAI